MLSIVDKIFTDFNLDEFSKECITDKNFKRVFNDCLLRKDKDFLLNKVFNNREIVDNLLDPEFLFCHTNDKFIALYLIENFSYNMDWNKLMDNCIYVDEQEELYVPYKWKIYILNYLDNEKWNILQKKSARKKSLL